MHGHTEALPSTHAGHFKAQSAIRCRKSFAFDSGLRASTRDQPFSCLHSRKLQSRQTVTRHISTPKKCFIRSARDLRAKAAEFVSQGAENPEAQLKPAFKKYLDAAGLARYNYSEWKRLAADGVYVPPPTIYTKLIYPLQFIKYNFVAEVIRYAWYQVWVRLVVAYAPYHKKAVIEGAKLDAYLLHRGQPQQPMHINKRNALLRYHWKMGPLQSLIIRLTLIKEALPKMLFSWRRKNIQQAEESNLAAPKII